MTLYNNVPPKEIQIRRANVKRLIEEGKTKEEISGLIGVPVKCIELSLEKLETACEPCEGLELADMLELQSIESIADSFLAQNWPKLLVSEFTGLSLYTITKLPHSPKSLSARGDENRFFYKKIKIAEEMMALRKSGTSVNDIAKKFNVSRHTASNYLKLLETKGLSVLSEEEKKTIRHQVSKKSSTKKHSPKEVSLIMNSVPEEDFFNKSSERISRDTGIDIEIVRRYKNERMKNSEPNIE